MRKRRLLVVILLVVVILAAGFAVYATLPSWLPQSTTLGITPTETTAVSGDRLAFTATVKAGATQVAGGTVTWTVTDGSLDKTTGTTVLFTAPAATGNVSVTLTAKFGGKGVYQASSATAHVTVMAATPAQPKSTTLTVTPKVFQLHGGDTLALSASLNPSDAPSQLITWALNPAGTGSLSSMTGASVNYTAPAVQTNTSVTITASFPGNAQYLASSDSSQGSIVAPQVVLKTPTTVILSPSSFSLESNGTQVLNASVQDSQGNVLAGKTITWALNPAGTGSLSSMTGASVNYTAPAVQTNTSVTIVASFAGDDTYLGSSGSSAGTLTPPSILPYLYTMTFNSATMTNVRLTGPIIMNGTSVTLLTCEMADMSVFNLSHFGLTASEMTVDDLSLYVTYIKANSPAFGGPMEISGGQNVSLGPTSSATFSNATLYVVRMEGSSANLTGLTSMGENLSGGEPYMPSILSAPSVDMTNTYYISGPVTWGSLTKAATNITVGQLAVAQFSFEHPMTYSLNRVTKTYTATNKWLLQASSASAINVQAYAIYFKVTAMGLVIDATGNDQMADVIPGGMNVGSSFSSGVAMVQAVYLHTDKLTLIDMVLSIE